MESSHPIRIRDKRTEKRYFIDNVIVDYYGAIIGPYGIAVYSVLVRHSNADTGRDSWPSHKTIAHKAGCSVDKTKEVIKQLAELRLIKVVHRYDDKTKAQTSNEYLILEPLPAGGVLPAPSPQGVPTPTKNPPSFKNPPPPPQKQAEEEPPSVKAEVEYVDFDDDGFPETPVHPLIKYIENNAGRRLTPNQRNKLAKGVPYHNPEYPSPCTLFEKDPLFTEYIDEKIAWATGGKDGKRVTTGRLVSAIRNYDNEHFGWLNMKQEKVEEAIPARRFKTVEGTSEEDYAWWEERQKRKEAEGG